VAKQTRSTKGKPKTKSPKTLPSSPKPTRKKKQPVATPKARAKGRVKKAVKAKPKKPVKKKLAAAVKPRAVKQKAGKKRIAKPKPRRVGRRVLPKAKRKMKAPVAPGARKKAIKPPAVKVKLRPLIPSAAVKAFGKAVNLFYHQDFDAARRAFANFINEFPEETEMIARARSYVAICDQRLSHPPSLPRDAEALYNRGIIELNSGRIQEAIAYFEKALKYEPGASHIIYSLAAAHARLGVVEQALAELKDAVRLRDVLRIQARHDSDFVSLYAHPEFQELVGWEIVEEAPPPPPAE
jgi:tetratricopeptide (TPR) repeat protein